jgi:hypothetical protein
VGEADVEPRPAAVGFVTTEHFALQSARAATIAESTGRATMFIASISGGLIALGLVATASRLGTAFYAFSLVILPTLAFVGLVTFERALQSAMDDHLLARRIALLRGYSPTATRPTDAGLPSSKRCFCAHSRALPCRHGRIALGHRNTRRHQPSRESAKRRARAFARSR